MKVILNRSLILSWTILFILFNSFISFAQPKIKFDSLDYTMTPVQKGASAELNIPFKNIGNQPLIITSAQGTGTPSVSKPQEPILPNGIGFIGFKMPTDFIGVTKQGISVKTNIDDQIIFLRITVQVTDKKERVVSGVVKDSIRIIPGTKVLIEGTNKAVQTDFEGKYSIKATPDEFLIFSFPGYQDTRIKASGIEINVKLKEGVRLKEIVGPAYYPNQQSKAQTTKISAKEVISNSSPKQYFKSNAKNNVFIVYVSNLSSLAQTDLEFQKKYNITYLPFSMAYSNYIKKYNLLTFKTLNKKYKTEWQSEIRKDAIGLDSFIKK